MVRRTTTGFIRRAQQSALAGWFACALSVGAAAVAPAHAQGLSTQDGPPTAAFDADELELYLVPDARGRTAGTFRVRNNGRAAGTATLYLNDWDRSADGENRFYALGSQPGSCRASVRVFPANIRLAPGSEQTVRVEFDAGQPLTTPCWSIVFVESAPTPTAGNASQVMVQMRTGVKVYVSPPAAPRIAELTELKLDRHRPVPPELASDTLGIDIVASVKNVGGMQVPFSGRIEYRTLEDAVVSTQRLTPTPVLPGALREIRLRVPKLPAGRYVAVALLDYGGAEILAGQAELEVRP